MAPIISPGDEAPNFDLASTEDAVLMLGDELARLSALLYFFPRSPGVKIKQDLSALAAVEKTLLSNGAKIMGISPAKLPALKDLQQELQLPFPLLHDDRDFHRHYGFEYPEEEIENPAGGAVLVDSDRRVLWAQIEVDALDGVLPEVEALLAGAKASTFNYPRSVLNRFIEWRLR
jgi:peroxiredoxin